MDRRWKNGIEEIERTERVVPCDLAFIAVGYTGPAQNGAFGSL